MSTLVIYTIYDHPADYPESFVVRKWDAVGGEPILGELVGETKTLGQARKLVPKGLVMVSRHPSDDPCIVESWL